MARSDRPDPHIATTRTAAAILALVSAFYLVALDRLPIVFGSDEAHFAIHAESLARSGRDLNGEAWPLFVRITDPMVPNHSTTIWYQPMLFYLMAPFVAFGVNEWTARLPVALIAIVNLFLLFAIGRRVFGDARYALLAALILAGTPAHLIVARQALDYILPLPFVLGWFWFLLRYLDAGRARDLAAGGFLLGAGLFSYIAAWLLMPCHLAVTAIAVWRSGRESRGRDLALCCAAFAIPATALAGALASRPDMLSATLGRYSIAGAAASAPGLWERVTLYWDYFNPSFLFFAGGSNPTQATGRAGVFLLPLLPLLMAGLREVFRNRSDRWTVACAALAAAPLPIAITMPAAASYSIARAMTLLPFVALVATLGVRWLMRERRLRLLAVACLIGLPIQFAMFVGDYRGDYQRRAGPRLDPDNLAAVAAATIPLDRDTAVPRVYLSHRLDEGGARWRFLMVKEGRLDLWERSRQINLAESPAIEPGALIVCRAGDPDGARLIAAGYRLVAAIDGVAGEAATVVLKAPG